MKMHKTVAAKGNDWKDSADPTILQNTEKQMQTITFSLGNFDDVNRTFRAIASTPITDRMGDSVEQMGWDFTWFLKNPTIPWAHDYYQPPVARVTEIGINEQGNLEFTYQAPPEGVYEYADTIWNLYRNQFMFAFSVGFIPHDYEGNYSEGYNFTKCELLEISAVVVPANPQAVVLAYKMGVVDEKGMKDLKSKMMSTVKNIDKELEKQNKGQKEKTMAKKETKGAVADELAEEELFEQKWQMFCDLSDIFWAFCDVWFDDSTPIDDYGSLVKELADLIAGEASDAPAAKAVSKALKNVDAEKVKAFRELLSGKNLTNNQEVSDTKDMSAKTKADSTDTLQSIHDDMQECMVRLKDFIATPVVGGDDPEDQEKAIKPETKDVNEITADAEDAEVKPETDEETGGAEQEEAEKQGEVEEPAEEEAQAEPEESEAEVAEPEEAAEEAAPEESETEEAEKVEPSEEAAAEEKGLEDDHLVDPEDLTDDEAEEIIKAVNEALAEGDE